MAKPYPLCKETREADALRESRKAQVEITQSRHDAEKHTLVAEAEAAEQELSDLRIELQQLQKTKREEDAMVASERGRLERLEKDIESHASSLSEQREALRIAYAELEVSNRAHEETERKIEIYAKRDKEWEAIVEKLEVAYAERPQSARLARLCDFMDSPEVGRCSWLKVESSEAAATKQELLHVLKDGDLPHKNVENALITAPFVPRQFCLKWRRISRRRSTPSMPP